MINYEELKSSGIKRNLPVLYNYGWVFIDNKLEFILNRSIINYNYSFYKIGTGNSSKYIVPELNYKLLSGNGLVNYLKSINITTRQWFNKWILGIGFYSDIYPVCSECRSKKLTWKGRISKGYSTYCSKSCHISNLNRTNWLDDSYKSRMSKFLSDRNKSGICGFGTLNDYELGVLQSKAHSDEAKEKWRKSREWYDSTGGYFGRLINGDIEGKTSPSHPRYKSGYYLSSKSGKVHYRSGYELAYYKLLDNNPEVEEYLVEPFFVNYTHNGITKKYYPDLLISYTDGRLEVEEIKPKSFINNEINTIKFEAISKYCKLNKIKFNVITEDNIFKHE